MDHNTTPSSTEEDPLTVPESPKPLAFTVDFGNGKNVDTQRHKTLVEKFQKKHRRGQSLSKIDEPPQGPKKHPLTGNLPRKSSFQSEGYFSSDEKSDRVKSKSIAMKRSELSLPLKNITMEPPLPQISPNLFSIQTPEIELKDISSPELDLVSPFSPNIVKELVNPRLLSSPECGNNNAIDDDSNFVDSNEYDFDKSDTVSDAGTYTLDADNYSEEQKARMSIDREFKIEQISVLKKTEDYIKSLYSFKEKNDNLTSVNERRSLEQTTVSKTNSNKVIVQNSGGTAQPSYKSSAHSMKMLSPILSPTQNMSITQNDQEEKDSQEVSSENKMMNNAVTEDGCSRSGKAFTKIMFPSQKSKNCNGLERVADQGSVISVTSSGAFRLKAEKEKLNQRRLSLTKSETHVEAYVGDKVSENTTTSKNRNLTANLVNVQSVMIRNNEPTANATSNGTSNSSVDDDDVTLVQPPCLVPSKMSLSGYSGKSSPSKIPSPIHTTNTSRPRSRNSTSSPIMDLSDSSLETESYLKPTQNVINKLQKKLSLEDHENTTEGLNNTFMKQSVLTHIRHNSLDEKCIMKISNKLEHFQSKNLQQGIDQTLYNQYHQKALHKIQNSPNNSPIRRSSSFSTKNVPVKNTNVTQKEANIRNSPNLTRNSPGSSSSTNSMQRSASTASIKPNYLRRPSATEHYKIDRNQFGDTESSSEEDFDNCTKKKDLSNLTNTRYNRAFSLRRARLDEPSLTVPVALPPRCPNTPEMRRKFQPEMHGRTERAISMDRKPKISEVQSRYLLNAGKKNSSPIIAGKTEQPAKNVPKVVGLPTKAALPAGKSQVFSRTDSGRFSMRANNKPASTGPPKSSKKDGGKKSSGRSNSSLSSREKEFQNWKRRKSYDPMKAAAEGKRKEIAKRQSNIMTQSCNEAIQNQDCDSSPSHSSSVHRSQSFHGTAALEQLISSEEEEDLTLSADEGFSPPTPSPCDMSPVRASLKHAWKNHILH